MFVDDSKCDVWSLGVIAYVLLSGCIPFDGDTNSEIAQAILNKPLLFDLFMFNSVSFEAKDFINKCLRKRPFFRMSAKSALQHSWFKILKTQVPKQQSLPCVQIIQRFKSFIVRSALAKIFIEAVAHTLLPEQVCDLREQFTKFDVTNTGEITVSDLRTVLKQFRGFDEEYVSIVVAHLNISQTGKIGYHEFLAATLSRNNVAEENLQVAFERISNHTAHIKSEDISRLLGTTNHDINQIMGEVGLSVEDANISFFDVSSSM